MHYYYGQSFEVFCAADSNAVLGELTNAHRHSLESTQRDAWNYQIEHLKGCLPVLGFGSILLEFAIPRMGRRVDAVILYNGIVFVVEYKVGASAFDKGAIDQVTDYSLDLKNFHLPSQKKLIIPILVATKAGVPADQQPSFSRDGLSDAVMTNGIEFNDLLVSLSFESAKIFKNRTTHGEFRGLNIDPLQIKHFDSEYMPTPTIVEAAQALYRGHEVDEIARSEAGPTNLSLTSSAISEIIATSRTDGRRKSICFVTGVPGAGKTLVGLNIATMKDQRGQAVYLSGNGPLVKVLREALAQDKVLQSKDRADAVPITVARRQVESFIQNIHKFRDHGLEPNTTIPEQVFVFDEAQRAWDQSQTARFMKKRGFPNFEHSEPDFLIGLVDQTKQWATIICLVGNGQEINKGEAGIKEWLHVLCKKYPHWDVYLSPQMTNEIPQNEISWQQEKVRSEKKLHLKTSIRSFRAEKLSDFMGGLIECKISACQDLIQDLEQYQLYITRDILSAKAWLKREARGSEKYGLVASSLASRLKADGIVTNQNIDPAYWFLKGKNDVRSCYALEDVVTEYEIQGLELDWVGLCWGADLRFVGDQWSFHQFKGTVWQKINDSNNRNFLLNSYRVLLTRARQGLVIYVPQGSTSDATRHPDFYDGTFDYLQEIGFKSLDKSDS